MPQTLMTFTLFNKLCFRHLTKLFDSLARLKFIKEGDENCKRALGMFAKDGEYVEFNKDCDCSGAVCKLLNN